MGSTNGKPHTEWIFKINPLGIVLASFGVSCILDSVAKIVTACRKSK